MNLLPRIVFITCTLTLFALTAIYYKKVISVFSAFNQQLVIHPFLCCLVLFALYVILVVISFPIMYFTIVLGFSLTQSFQLKKRLVLSGAALLVTVSFVTGGICAFLLSRYWLSKCIKTERLSQHRIFRAINHEVTRNGWKTVLLLRLAPFPFALVSYTMGMTNLKLSCFVKGTFAIALHVIVWLWIGSSITSLTQMSDEKKSHVSAWKIVILMLEIAIGISVIVLIGLKSKKRLNKIIEEERAD